MALMVISHCILISAVISFSFVTVSQLRMDLLFTSTGESCYNTERAPQCVSKLYDVESTVSAGLCV